MAFKKSNPSIGSSYGGAKPTRSNIGAKAGKPGTMKKGKAVKGKAKGSLYGDYDD